MRYIALMSGGIDSPVAAYLMLRTGAEVRILNMDNRPFGETDELRKVEELAGRLKELFPDRVKLFRAPHGLFLSAFKERSNPKYTCVLCKKGMLNLADLLCDRWECRGIIMGDSMGQVASQTLPNMASVSAGIRHHIIRPLIGFDKVDIEAVGKEIGTFDISIKRTTGCTATPRFPITRADARQVAVEARKAGFEELLGRVADGVVEVDLP
ncbi:MAG: tRNA 4-thiouridine(8) synthase ThiI [Thermoplasmatota archaeon]